MHYRQLETKADLAIYLDDIIAGMRAMVKKVKSRQSPESLVNVALTFAGTENLFFLIGEEEEVFQGFLQALLIPDPVIPWVEVQALWTRPGVGMKCREEAFDLLLGWARVKGAKRLQVMLTRSPEVFYEAFYKQLGFRKIGLILEGGV